MSFTRSVKFVRRSIIVKHTFHALPPLDRAPGHFGQGIIVIKLILIDFDGHNANITFRVCTDVVFSKNIRDTRPGGGGQIDPPPPITSRRRR